MDKEEAMKILKDFHDKSALFSVRTALGTLHPELKESEDKRVIKDIKSLLEWNKEQGNVALPYPFVTNDEALAWLEKQGESYTKRDVDDAYLKGISDAKNELEKQGEQRAAWSEEDETKLKSACALIKNTSLNGNEGIVDSTIDWLKSLKQRYTWKPSDEQIGVIEAVINNRSFQRRHLDSLYEQLKKLKE